MRRVTGYHEFSWDKTGLGVTLSIWPPRGLGQFAVRIHLLLGPLVLGVAYHHWWEEVPDA